MLKLPSLRNSSKRWLDRDLDGGFAQLESSTSRDDAMRPSFNDMFVDSPLIAGLLGTLRPQESASAPLQADVAAASEASAASTPADVTVAEGATVEISGDLPQSVYFAGTTGTLKIDSSISFAGQIIGLSGDDALDLADISFSPSTQVTYLGTHEGGTLTVTDGLHTANIALTGDYLSSHWNLSSDGYGGTLVVDPVPANNWQELKIGAGGFLSGINIAPDGTMVVRTDTYGAYIWTGTAWKQLVTASSMPAEFVTLGNNQGVYEIQIASSNTNILYMTFLGYVFKSTDKGTTWTKTNFAQSANDPNDANRSNGQKMAIDPSNPNIVYVGTEKDGLFVTTDGGSTWKKVAALPVGTADSNGLYPGITGIMFDPALGTTGGKTNTIFASSYGNGVYESTDGGATWTHLNGGPQNVQYAAVSSNGAYYVTGDNSSTLWRFQNGTWTKMLSSYNMWVYTVAVNPNNPLEVVVQSVGGDVTVSYDGGTTWSGFDTSATVTSNDIPWLKTTGTFLSIGGSAFNPLVPNQLIDAAGIGVWTTTVPQNLTTSAVGSNLLTYNYQYSVSWTSQSNGIEQLVANQIIVPPGGKPVLASWDRAFFYVSDPNSFPTSFGPVSGTFSGGWSLDYASSSPNYIVGIAESNISTDGELSGYSSDGGKTWTTFASMPAFVGTGAMGGTIAASSPTDIVWAPANGYQPYYTLNGGQTWNPVNLPGVTSWSTFDWAYYLNARTVTADRVLPNTFYLYYPGNGVYRSTDGGVTWKQMFSGEISPVSYLSSEISSVPNQASNLFFTGGPQTGTPSEPFMRSTDGGAHWTAVANVLNVSCFGFGAAATAGGYPSIYIVGYVNGVYGVWQSINNAQSWTNIGTWPNGSLDQITTISGDPNIFGQVYVGFRGSGYAYLSATSTGTGPTVSSIVESPATGNLNAGKVVTLTLNLSSTVTVAGGTPTLTLNDGGVATYTGGSGTGALTFSYTVAAGQNTSSLSATAVNLNGATVADSSGNAANFSLSGITQAGPQIDTAAPAVSSLATSGTGITSGSGNLNAGKVVTLTLNLSEAVTVAGGTPTLTLNNGAVATYTGGSGSTALTFSYTVAAGQNTSDLTVTAVNLNSATVKDGAGNAANLAGAVTNPSGTLQIDTTAPTVSSVAASGSGITSGSGNIAAGSVVTLTMNLSEAVTVAGGTPTLTLNNGGVATYTGGSGSTALTFSYTVAAGQSTPDLTVTAVNLNSATVKDGAGNAANLAGGVTNPSGTLQISTTASAVSSVTTSGSGITSGSGNLNAGKVVTLTLNLNNAVTVAGGTPTLTLNDGGVATYTGGSGSTALTFSYTVAAGQNTSDLAVTAVNLNSATVKDSTGNAANLAGAVTNPSGTLQIDTTAPSVSSVAASGTGITSGSGNLNAGKVVTLTMNLSEAVTVAGGTPTLTLNNGGVATYTGGSGSTALTFSYTVAAGQNTPDLTVTAVNLNSATVKDGAGNAANLAGAVTNPSGTLQISTTASAVSSVTTSGTGITSGSGNLTAGSVVTLTLNLNNAVTVAGGTPTLTLNDGGVATYTGGSGSTALTFSYTVAAGQNTSDLAVTAVNLNSATVRDSTGNAANLTGAVTNPTGTLRVDTTSPTVSSVAASGNGITSNSGNLTVGSVVTLTVNWSEAVTVAGGTPILVLNNGGRATYTGGSGSTALTFSYTVGASDSSVSALAITQGVSNGATIKDSAGNLVDPTGALATFSNLSVDQSGVIEASGATKLVVKGGYYYLQSTNGTSSGIAVAYGSSKIAVSNDAGAWSAIGAEQSGNGYLIAWKLNGSNQYAVWNADSQGRYLSNAVTQTSGSSAALMSIETSFQQDLNGDGMIGVAAPPVTGTVIESYGSTSLAVVGNHYSLFANGTSSGPTVTYGGSQIAVSSDAGAWTAIGAEKSGNGYLIAWKMNGSDQYAVWNADSQGNYVSNALTITSGSSTALKSIETSFQQDLNGDGVIGVAAAPVTGTVIESYGSTSLAVVGNHYSLFANGTSSGPTVTYGGSQIAVSSDAGAWTAIGAEKSGNGYLIAWKMNGSDQYAVWNADSQGNYVSNALTTTSGSSTALRSIETSFQQDLNGDGVIGVATAPVTGTVIESYGSTSLAVVGNHYSLFANGTSSGPIVTYGGSQIAVSSDAGAWTAIGAEQSGNGYLIAWKMNGSDQYAVWNADSQGNYVSNALTTTSGSDAAFQALEATFHQDLNGDGVIVLSGSGTIIGANSLTIGSGAIVELLGAYSGTVNFAGATGTLVLDQSTEFSGTFSGQLTTTNFVDLRDVTAGASATVSYTGNNSPGQLSIGDGTNTATFALTGNYSLGNFIVSSDGNGGTLLVDPPISTDQNSDVATASSDPSSAWLDSIDSKLALWSQLSASAFPTSPFDTGAACNTGTSEIGGTNPAYQLAASTIAQQHYQNSLA